MTSVTSVDAATEGAARETRGVEIAARDLWQTVKGGKNHDLVHPFIEAGWTAEYQAANFMINQRPLFNEQAYKVLINQGRLLLDSGGTIVGGNIPGVSVAAGATLELNNAATDLAETFLRRANGFVSGGFA